MAVYDLSPAALPNTTVNVRGNLTPVTNSPFTVGQTATVILQENKSRASAAIFNAGTSTVLLLEGTTPITTANYNYPLPPNRLWEPEPNFRFFGSIQAIAPSGSALLYVSQSVTLL